MINPELKRIVFVTSAMTVEVDAANMKQTIQGVNDFD